MSRSRGSSIQQAKTLMLQALEAVGKSVALKALAEKNMDLKSRLEALSTAKIKWERAGTEAEYRVLLEEVEAQLQCHITCTMIESPIIVNGQAGVFEAGAIHKWLSKKHTNPLTRMALQEAELKPSNELTGLIAAFANMNIALTTPVELGAEQRRAVDALSKYALQQSGESKEQKEEGNTYSKVSLRILHATLDPDPYCVKYAIRQTGSTTFCLDMRKGNNFLWPAGTLGEGGAQKKLRFSITEEGKYVVIDNTGKVSSETFDNLAALLKKTFGNDLSKIQRLDAGIARERLDKLNEFASNPETKDLIHTLASYLELGWDENTARTALASLDGGHACIRPSKLPSLITYTHNNPDDNSTIKLQRLYLWGDGTDALYTQIEAGGEQVRCLNGLNAMYRYALQGERDEWIQPDGLVQTSSTGAEGESHKILSKALSHAITPPAVLQQDPRFSSVALTSQPYAGIGGIK